MTDLTTQNDTVGTTNRRIKLVAFVFGGLTVVLLRLWLYDDVQRHPKQFHPPLLLFLSIMGYLVVNLLAFVWNLFKALASIRGSKDEQEVEKIMVPAFRGQIADEKILRFMEIPASVSFGTMAASIAIFLTFLVRGECWGLFDGYVTFVNNSNTEVEQVTVSGFPRRPPVSAIAPGGRKRGFMPATSLPRSVTIVWRTRGAAEQQAAIPLTAVPQCATSGEIRFDCTREGKWAVHYDPVSK